MATAALAPETQIGPYQLLKRLGAGGIGEVWKARDRRLNRVVALKFINTQRAGSSVLRDLMHEARASSALNHPNIATLFDIGEVPSGTYLVMEFIDGMSLRQRLDGNAVPVPESLQIADQVAEALSAAHRQGVVHRDLKPENIMLRVDGCAKLVDFGLAHMLPWSQGNAPDSETVDGVTIDPAAAGQIVGTFHYMAPEQARGEQVTPASDVFSFGIVFYELLTGKHPFLRASLVESLHAIMHDAVEPMRPLVPSLPNHIDEVVSRALEKEPGRRFPSGVELSRELAEIRQKLGSGYASPVKVAKPSWRAPVMVAVLLLAVLLAGLFARPAMLRSHSGQVDSLAVMEFHAGSADATATSMADGLADELEAVLGHTGLRIASRTRLKSGTDSSDPEKVGKLLRVDAVLEGSIRTYGSKCRIHAELVDSSNGFQIWHGTFTADNDDVANGGEKLAAEIAQQLSTVLKERESSTAERAVNRSIE